MSGSTSVRSLLDSGKEVLSISLHYNDPALIESLGYLGFDAVVIDAEHGRLDEPGIENLVRAAELRGVAPCLRIEWDSDAIHRSLCAGIVGLQIPHVSTPDQAEAVARELKFRPVGMRGIGSFRANAFGLAPGAKDTALDALNHETFCMVQIEDQQGVANAKAIADVPGVDVLLVGRVDLADEMGIRGQTGHPGVVDAVEQIRAAAEAAGVALGLSVPPTPDAVEGARQLGASVILTSVTQVITTGAAPIVDAVVGLRS